MMRKRRSLTDRHSRTLIEEACETAHSFGEYRLRTVRELLGRRTAKQQHFEFAAEHDVIRPLINYSEFVRTCLRKEQCS